MQGCRTRNRSDHTGMTRCHILRTTAVTVEKQWCASVNGAIGLQVDPRRTVADQAEDGKELKEAGVTGTHLESALQTKKWPLSP